MFQVNDQNRPVANLPVVVFRSQPREMTLPKAEYVTFGFYFRTLVLFLRKQSLNITVLKLRGFFSVLSSHNPKTLRQTRAQLFLFQNLCDNKPCGGIRCRPLYGSNGYTCERTSRIIEKGNIAFNKIYYLPHYDLTDNNTDNNNNCYYYDIDNNIINNNSDLI